MLSPIRVAPTDSHPGGGAPHNIAPGFSALGCEFATEVRPTPLPAPYLVGLSKSAAELLEWDNRWLQSEAGIHMLAGNTWPGPVTPFASVYSGHQFGVWAGQLGDGRALSLGESNGFEVQLKGAGLTPYSRMGDGRAVLRSSIREYLCSEAMAGLGIPTTRALSVVGSNHPVYRETVETAAVVIRLAPSFVRFGHFEHFCHHGLHAQLKVLADYVIERHYPQCLHSSDDASPYAALLVQVVDRTAHMVALWQSVGFCHGVMNTDNMSILGLTLDYGPFQFLDQYVPEHRCNHSDTQGRYAFHRQPSVAYWNLTCLAQALVPLVPDTEALVSAINSFKTRYTHYFSQAIGAKFGLVQPFSEIGPMVDALFGLLARDAVDHTIFWRRLSHWTRECNAQDTSVRDLFVNRHAADAWLAQYANSLKPSQRIARSEAMLRTNPKYVLHNHLGEIAIQAAQQGDFSVTQALHEVLNTPCDEHPEHEEWAGFAPEWAQSISISCSS